jgi:hypothetical protein
MKALQYAKALIETTFHGEPYPLKDDEPWELSLHESDPQDEGGEMLGKTELHYPGYQRLVIPRTTAEWASDGIAEVSNVKEIRFPAVDRQKAGARKFKVRFLLLRGAESKMPVHIAAYDEAQEIDADHSLICHPGECRFSYESARHSRKWVTRILECEFHGKPFPLEPEEGLEHALFDDDPQDRNGELSGHELDYPNYKRITTERSTNDWTRNDSEAFNNHRLAWPGFHEGTTKGRTWPARWVALVGSKSRFPVRVFRMRDTVVIKSGYQLVVPAGKFTTGES